jgi:hypothetical protein
VCLVNTRETWYSPRLYGGVECEEGTVYLCRSHLGPARPDVTKSLRMSEAIEKLEESMQECRKLVTKLRKTQLKKGKAEMLMMAAARNGLSYHIDSKNLRLIPWHHLGTVDAAYRKSEGTAWGLAIAFGRAVAKTPPYLRAEQQYRFVQMILGST